MADQTTITDPKAAAEAEAKRLLDMEQAKKGRNRGRDKAQDTTVTRPRRDDGIDDIFETIEIGMPVYYYADGRRGVTKRYGFIAAVSGSTIAIHVFDRGLNRVWAVKDGVKHLQDATLSDMDRQERGAWELPLYMQRLLFDS